MQVTPPNTLMVLTNPDAAQSVLRPLCLLSGFAAHQHVRRAEEGDEDPQWRACPSK